MPGLLTTIFDGTDGGDSAQSQQASGDGDVAFDPGIAVSGHMGGSIETPDGSTHGFERTDSVAFDSDTSLHAAGGAVAAVDDAMLG